jgi:hypothetical protein
MRSCFIFLPVFFISAAYSQSFTKVTMGPLVSTPGDSRSVNWVDVNNDGYPDCMITNGPAGGQNNMLYINNTVGGFTAVLGDSVVLDGKPSDGATWADTDNDGDEDCFIVNWYDVDNLFYTNNGSGNFTRINSGGHVNDGGFSETASWGDYDNDGLVDLYVNNSSPPLQNFLYKNTGSNGFLKIVAGPMVTDGYESRCVNWTDMDLDGDVDLFITNESGQNENIYQNNGSGNFTSITTGPLVNQGANTMSGSWGDYDNDGDLDVFLANHLSNNSLFRNDGNFNFTKIIGDTVSKQYGYSMSSSWSDVDNDGDLDLFVTNAFGSLVKHLGFFYLNNGNGSFSRISNNAVTADSAWTYGCAFGDYDNDGFEDLAVATCRFKGVDYPDLLYHNDGNANKWITIQLQGTISNRSAIGTKIKLKAVINGSPVWQLREISAQNAYCSQNDIRAHFGLGNATQVDSVKIEWPSGIQQYSTGLTPNQFMTIIEALPATAIQKHKAGAMALSVFPNPASKEVVVELEEGFKPGDKLVICDEAGKKLAEITINYSTRQYLIDLKKHNLAAGAYFISCWTKAGHLAQKVIIAD